MADYIATTDIRDKVIATFTDLAGYVTESTNFMNDFTASKGLETTDIETDPLHYRVKEMLIYFAQMRASEDRIGLQANVAIRAQSQPVDMYQQKYDRYREEFERLRDSVTEEMIKGIADTPAEYTNMSIRLDRG